MIIQVLGSGCPTCAKFKEAVTAAVKEMGLTEKVEYITGPAGTAKIVELGAMSSPVLAINHRIAMVGFTPNLNKIKAAISLFENKNLA